jgi:hypothetical protein
MERVNQCMETFLRCFVSASSKRWAQWISLTEFRYNTSFHTSIGRSPFEALYGHPPRYFGFSSDSVVADGDMGQWLQECEVMTSLIKQHLHRASVRMKNQADKGRIEREFSVGELVFLKLQPYVQSSLAPRANHSSCKSEANI